MGAMKSLLVDDDRSDLLKLCTDISRARDEYREELFREREIKHELLRALKALRLDDSGVDERIPDAYPLSRTLTAGSIRAVIAAIAKAESR